MPSEIIQTVVLGGSIGELYVYECTCGRMFTRTADAYQNLPCCYRCPKEHYSECESYDTYARWLMKSYVCEGEDVPDAF